jgi:hypothetical protein
VPLGAEEFAVVVCDGGVVVVEDDVPTRFCNTGAVSESVVVGCE